MATITLNQAREAVAMQRPFKGDSLFGEDTASGAYVVYSYGRHWPLLAWIPGVGWLANETKRSVTTSRHLGAVRPAGRVAAVSLGEMRDALQAVE